MMADTGFHEPFSSPDSVMGLESYPRPGSSRGYDSRPLTSGTAGSYNSDASFGSEFSSSGSSFTSTGGNVGV